MSFDFHYTKTARPTTYKDTKFRSELEAAWAAFFDIRGIAHEYEPILELEFWRPDFSITLMGDPTDIVLAEVKPYASSQMWMDDTDTLRKIHESFQKEFLVLLLGASPALPANLRFGLGPNGELLDNATMFSSINFGDEDRLSEDWSRAKNLVRWRQ
jgi:hypothetical protein